ncbi:MAG: LolA family protein [Planctomycetota bacterium]
MTHFLLALAITCVLTGCEDGAEVQVDGEQPPVAHQPDDTPPTDAPPADQPPEDEPPADTPADVPGILAALERAGEANPQITAAVHYRVDQPQTGDSETRTGQIKFDRGGEKTPSRFYVGFDTLQLGGSPAIADKVEYAFDGRWLTVAKHRIKQLTRYEIAAEGEIVDAFKLGKGPFPLPFGQDAAAMQKIFTITTRQPRESDPAGCDYLLLIPKAEHAEAMQFTRLEMWIDRATHLPARIVSRDKSKNTTTAAFTNIRTDVTFANKDFHLPRQLGWQVTVQRMKDQ